ncbi:F-box protein At3g08750-like [Silene latifolia]|uniref:F-box protein At3g08750-like n=1 Tax=Silene latifolia TaxID=37657 RepID=UPI003D76E5D8
MSEKKKTMTAEADHRYSTRCRTAPYFPKEVSRIEGRGKHQVFVPCKTRKKERNILSLPRDIIFNILILIPATVLHQVVRYVCKQWNDILNDPRFIKTQCQSSSACLLIQTMTQQHNVYYIEGDVLTQVAFPNTGKIYGSCNGLVLFQNFSYPQILSVINPVTKVKISLPPLHWLGTLISSIGFAITSCGHYKVMVKLPDEDHRPKIQVMVFTIGVDKAWRIIDLQINSIMDHNIIVCPAFFIAGMMYWYYSNHTCYALDVDTETIYQFSKPDNVSVQLFGQTNFLNLGVGLGLIQKDEGKWRLWKLTDEKSCVWTELDGINETAILSTLSKNFFLRDCKSVVPTRLIDDMLWFHFVGCRESIVIRFNLANKSYVIFRVKNVPPVIGNFHHVHTLVSPKKCYF